MEENVYNSFGSAGAAGAIPQAQPQQAPQPQQPVADATYYGGASSGYAAPGYAAPAYGAAPGYAAPQQPAPKAKKSRGWIIALVALALVALCIFGVSSCMSSLAGMSGTSFISEDTEPDSIAVIELAGEIAYDGSVCSPDGLRELLQEAEDDENIVAVVLHVNSGGGAASAGEEMAIAVREFSKPVVVSSASINASAAYEISSQADYLYCLKTSEMGAIGTNLSLVNYSELLDKIGIHYESISSSPEKDSSYGHRALTDEEREMYQQVVTEINDAFIENVAEGRGMEIEDVRKLANGMPYGGVSCVENGLADEIGTLQDALDKAAELAGVGEDYNTFELSLYEPYSYSWFDLLGMDYQGQTNVNLQLSVDDAKELLKELSADEHITQ